MAEGVWVAIIVALGGGASGWFATWLNKRLNRAHDTEEITDMVVKRLREENSRMYAAMDSLQKRFDAVVLDRDAAVDRADAAEDQVRQVRNMAAQMLAHVELLESKVPPPPPPRPWLTYRADRELGEAV